MASNLREVFGISTRPPKSYLRRDHVDGAFERSLESPHHIAIYGSSKQGKTALRQKYLKNEQCLFVHCSTNTTIAQIYSTLAGAAGARLEYTERTSPFGVTAFLPFLAHGKQSETALDATNAQSLVEILRHFQCDKKYIVLENFHYVPLDVQRQFACDLKTFHELSVRFIILGVWRQARYFQFLNSDLVDRVTNITVEPWLKSDLARIVDIGSNELNIHIPPARYDTFVDNCFGNVGLFSEFLRLYCELHDVLQTSNERKVLDNSDAVDQARFSKLDDHYPELIRTLQYIANTQYSTPGDLGLRYYLVKALLQIPVAELKSGVLRTRLLDEIKSVHPIENKDDIRADHLTVLLSKLPELQREMVSPLLYYDFTEKKLHIVDSRSLFVLQFADSAGILTELPDPGSRA